MPYRSSDKTRQKKDAKRTSMMQAAVQVFAEKATMPPPCAILCRWPM